MATRELSRTPTATSRAFVARWSDLLLSDDGQSMEFSQYTDKSVQVAGTFGGASIRIEGSNDGTNWAALTDPQGNDLLIVAPKIEQVTECTLYIRPVVVGGNGTTSLTVSMLCKEGN